MRLGIDVDGVLADFGRAFAEAANTIWPDRFPPNYVPPDWDFGGMSPADQKKVWAVIKRTPNFWSRLRPYSENITALARTLIGATYLDIWLVTSRVRTEGATIARQTEQWIRSCGVREGSNFLGIITVEDAKLKQEVYPAVGIEYSIDDYGPTVLECETLPNHHAALLSRPWNAEYNVKWRVDNLSQFFSEVGLGRK